jgi:opacity protein-like surface antigen
MKAGVKRCLLRAAVAAACLAAAGPVSAQLVLGQYEDEAPLGTWNVFGAPSAASAGLGVSFVRAADPSISLTNPALLLGLPRVSVVLSGSYAAATLFRFSFVNTGAASSAGALAAGVLGFDHGAFAFRRGDWAFALAAAVPESYARPAVLAGFEGEGVSYGLSLDQAGRLRLLQGAVARRLPAAISVGLGLSYAYGALDRTVVERTAAPARVVTITDDKSERFGGFFLNGGVSWAASPRLTASLAFRSSYLKKGEGRSLLRYEVPEAGSDIRIDAEAVNEYRQPWIVGAGCAYALSEAWSFAAELAWFGWSGYEVRYFDEPLVRSFRDVVRAGAGAEYLAPVRMFGRPAAVPFRLGFSFDPQPMREPRSSYLALTLGTGLRLAALAIDVGGSIGGERGSGDSLKAAKIVLSLRYIIDE